MTRKQQSKVTKDERQKRALDALYLWEYSAALTLSVSALRRRSEFLAKAQSLLPPGDIEWLTKDAQIEAILDAAKARGVYREE